MSAVLRILLIDDNPDDRSLVIRELRREFPDVQVKQIIEDQGLAQELESGEFDVVITDYQLRWTNGLAVLKAIKTRWPNCPVIMFTATGSEEIAVEAMKAGLNDYVLKSPKHFSRLPAAVRMSVEQIWQRQALQEAENRYRSLFDRVPVGLYRSTPSGKFLDANPALVRLLGYPNREALMAINVGHLYVSPEERQQWQATVEHEGVIQDFEVRLRRNDGTIIWVRNNATTVKDEHGRTLYYEGAMVV
jgi:PAS domain S-box-containing protein